MKRYLAEFIGTFVLVFGGCGTAVLDAKHVGVLGVSLAFGLTLLTMAYAIGHVSGCHINPAVTLGLVIAGRHDKSDLLGYWAAQIAGGVLAALVLYAVASGLPAFDLVASGLASNGFAEHSPDKYSLVAGLIAEVIGTALLLFTVLGATDKKSPAGFAGLPIGLVLTLIHLITIPVTNTSVNPARSIGPALVLALFGGEGWAVAQLWLFIIGPMIGAALGVLAYRALRPVEDAPPKEALAR